MTNQRRKGSRAIAMFLAFALVQVAIQLSFAAPASVSVVVPQRFIARLTSSGAVTINGASAGSGASLLTGATIETPAATSATIDLGALGMVEMQPNSEIQLDFADDGTVRVKVVRGCIAIKKKGPGEAEAYTAEGASEKTNGNRKGMAFCYANGGLSPLGQAATSGAGGGGGLGAGTTAAIVIAAVVVPVSLYFAFRDGRNPSPSAP